MGHVLVRGCQMNVEPLHTSLNVTHCHRRMVCVPIEVPSIFARYLKSAASRSHCPGEDGERSGVDFSMRTIGRRATEETENQETAETEETAEMVIESDDEADDEEMSANPETTSNMDPHIMSSRQLKSVFKGDAAEVQAVLFQHSTRITPHAKFLEKTKQIKVL